MKVVAQGRTDFSADRSNDLPIRILILFPVFRFSHGQPPQQLLSICFLPETMNFDLDSVKVKSRSRHSFKVNQ